MKAIWVIALTAALVYGVLAGCAPHIATDVGVLFAIVIVLAWALITHLDRSHG